MIEKKPSSTATIKHFIKTHKEGYIRTKTWEENGSITKRQKEYLYKPHPSSDFFNTPEIANAAENFLEQCKAKNTGVEKILHLRHKHFSATIHDFLKQNSHDKTQIILVGCGYSPYAVKKNKEKYQNTNFFEVESSTILEEKIKTYLKNQISPNATYIGIDSSNREWYSKLIFNLISKGVDPQLPTCFILEAEIAYLTEEEIKQILKEIHNTFPKVSITFNYISPAMASQKTNNNVIDQFTNLLAQRHVFFSSGFDTNSLEQLATASGLNFATASSGNNLAEQYGVDTQKDEVLENFGVCTLRT